MYAISADLGNRNGCSPVPITLAAILVFSKKLQRTVLKVATGALAQYGIAYVFMQPSQTSTYRQPRPHHFLHVQACLS